MKAVQGEGVLVRDAAVRGEAEPGEQVPGGVVAVEDFGLDLGQAEMRRGVGQHQACGFGGEAAIPVRAPDGQPEFGGGRRQDQADGPDALGRAVRDDGPAQGGLVPEALAMAGEPFAALVDRRGDGVAGEVGGLGIGGAGESGGDVGFGEGAQMDGFAGQRRRFQRKGDCHGPSCIFS